LEKDSGKKLLHQTGLVIFGDPATSEIIKGVRLSSERYQIPIEEWLSEKIRKKFPQASVPENYLGIYEPTGGYLEVENCIQTFCEQATKKGAQLNFNEKVIAWKKTPIGFEVITDKNSFLSDQLVITSGPWASRFFVDFSHYFKVHRAPLFWFRSEGQFKKENGVPCFAFDTPDGFFYGFTESNGLVKLALHRALEEVVDPYTENREVQPQEFQPMKKFVHQFFRGLDIAPQKSAICFYTLSPDTHFIVDQIPNVGGAYLAGGFSGHGFKFASLVGEVLADWVSEGKTKNPVDFLKMERLNN
jgi:glycine/D-amino acid oxidase-like deaminating enzyme